MVFKTGEEKKKVVFKTGEMKKKWFSKVTSEKWFQNR